MGATGVDDEAGRQDAPTKTGWKATGRSWLTYLFVGDWHPVVRDPLDLFRLSFAVGAVIFLIQGDGDAFVRLLLPGVLVLVVRALNIPRPIDWVFCLAMAFQGWGNALQLFTELSWYDNTVHITLPMSLAPILYIAFSRMTSSRTPPNVSAAGPRHTGWR
jgi:hypothetical protein